VGSRAGLDRCGKSRPTGIQSPDRPARSQSLYRLSYPAQTNTNIIHKYVKRKTPAVWDTTLCFDYSSIVLNIVAAFPTKRQ
jgi:hypothetical protein